MEVILTIADAQEIARKSFDEPEACWSQIIMDLKVCFAAIRQRVIDLLGGETLEKYRVTSLIEMISVERIQMEATEMVDEGQLREALIYIRKQLSNLRRRAQRVLCSPFNERETIIEFIEYLGEEGHEVPTLKYHANMCELTWE